ncbi:hypothetical protein [Lacimicrobium alkaliphilum]|uniref:Uncharacterized protein n=1 Tax=Lacimicrobium alkaliphilum TaxID=1526571 RepID=A0A0U3B0E9_9ALTE|nr:hypothetical protein [Lacimicrobium alkaliphilum]ALS99855.1 hypothetical protein AT746_17360 [Lacimicrobium alkaliphilum]
MAKGNASGRLIQVIAIIAIGFGVLTIKEGGMVLFDIGAARTAAGNYVPFVLWFNSMVGFAYVSAGAGLWLGRRWAVWLAVGIAVATVATFSALGIHIYSGGSFEIRTLVAMSLRTSVWIIISALSWRFIVLGA